MNLIFTLHAKEQMVERGISKRQVTDTIHKGSKVVQTDGFLASHSYIKVAYKIRGNTYIIKTVMIR